MRTDILYIEISLGLINLLKLFKCKGPANRIEYFARPMKKVDLMLQGRTEG